MQINGTIINADITDIINTLKTQLAEHGTYLFAKMFDSGDDLMVCCPYHKNGQERKPSAGIRKSDGLFHCLACGETHALTELIANCLGYKDSLQGYKWLINNFATTEVQERGKLRVRFSRGNVNADVPNVSAPTISEEELDKYRYIHPYMYERGLTDGIIEMFDVGYDKSTDSITFPVRDIEGNCQFVATRKVKYKLFTLPKNIDKPLYGLYEFYKFVTADKVYVCEGLFDCLRLWCNGKFAVAGFGCLFSDKQITQLQDLPCRQIVLALDNDSAGRKASVRLRKLLKNKLIYDIVLPKGRKDIGECTDEEIQHLEEYL